VAHRNARLTVHGRRLIVTRVLEEGWSPVTAAEAAGVSRATVYKWLARFRDHGEAGLEDRPSRPRRCPNRLNERTEARILLARKRRRWGPHLLEFYLGVPRSTAYKVLVRHGCSRLADFDRPTGKPIRYVKDRPGELLHVDVKKLGRIPDGGGWRVHGRDGVLDRSHKGGLGYDKLHIAVDDHSRLAFVQVHADETGETCAAFLADAVAWFAGQGILIERVMTDNAKNYTVSRAFQRVLRDHRIKHKRIRAFRPQTNGKVERFNRTLVDEFAYARIFTSNAARLDALPRWVRYYNTRRRHTSLEGHTPTEIVNNLCGKNI
jgi:transposase InsO family protein